MAGQRFGTIRHKSLAYFLLRAGPLAVAVMIATGLCLVLPSPASEITAAVRALVLQVSILIALIYSRRLIHCWWVVRR